MARRLLPLSIDVPEPITDKRMRFPNVAFLVQYGRVLAVHHGHGPVNDSKKPRKGRVSWPSLARAAPHADLASIRSRRCQPTSTSRLGQRGDLPQPGVGQDTARRVHRIPVDGQAPPEERHGARVALYGRKINLAETPLELTALLRPVLRRELTPEEAARAYHGALGKRGVRPARALADDLQITEPALQA